MLSSTLQQRPVASNASWLGIAFVAGVIGVLVFHQLALALLHAAGITPGVAYSMSAAGFLELLAAHTEFQHQVDLYLHCLIAMLGRSGSCNLMHDVPERCARWLLSTRDRVGGDQFTLTQEVLATMLGVHRPAVTLAAGALQKAGLIRYSRGQIAIVDADGLREASCECYGIVADEFRRVLGGP